MIKIILGSIIGIAIMIGIIKSIPALGIILAVIALSVAAYFIVKIVKERKEEKEEQLNILNRNKRIQYEIDKHNQEMKESEENRKLSLANRSKHIQQEIDKHNQEMKEREEHRRLYLQNKQNEFNSKLSEIEKVPISVTDKSVKKRALAEMPEVKFSKITRKTNIDSLFPLVIVDVETTGLNCRKNQIIEVSAIKYEADFTPDFCFTTLCKAKSPLPNEITQITNITDDMLSDAPTFEAVVDSLSDFIDGCNICGYNLEFDLKFLFVHGLDLPTKVKYYDVMELAKSKLKREPYNSNSYNYDVTDYKLDTVAKYYNIYRNNAHRSLSDCYATGKVFKELIEEFIM